MSARAGFTLFELLTVITIIGVVLAVTLGSYQGWGDAQAVRASSERIEAALANAHDIAVSRRVPVRFSYETAAGITNGVKKIARFQLATHADGQPLGESPQRLPGAVWLVRRVPVEDPERDVYGTLVFQPNGSVQNVETNQPTRLFVVSRRMRESPANRPNVAYQLDIDSANGSVSTTKLNFEN